MTGSRTPWPIATCGNDPLEVELEAFNGRDEAAQRDEGGGTGACSPEAERVRHDGTLREAAENRPFGPDTRLVLEPVEPVRNGGVGRQERSRVGKADLLNGVPVGAARRQRERAAWSDAEEAPLRVEHVEQREQVVLVGAAAVEQDEQALWLCGRRPKPMLDGHFAVRAARVSGSGVNTCSSRSRSCS